MEIQVTVPPLTQEELKSLPGTDFEKVVEKDLDAFNEWFCTHIEQGTDRGLIKPERALLKTYIWYKAHPGEAPKRLGG